MIYKIRLILDSEVDVFRDIAVGYNDTLEDLHNAITNAFGFDGTEMASFYLTDDDWKQGEEVPLFAMEESENAIAMGNFILKNTLTEENNKLIYIYDFFAMWSFFVELISVEEDSNQIDLPCLLLSVGNLPSEAPEKEFIGEDIAGETDDTGGSQDIEDFDFDNFDELMN